MSTSMRMSMRTALALAWLAVAAAAPPLRALTRTLSLSQPVHVTFAGGSADAVFAAAEWYRRIQGVSRHNKANKTAQTLVGCVDDNACQLLVQKRVRDVFDARVQGFDGSAAHASGGWKRFAKVRVATLETLVQAGFDVVMSDSDVAWIDDADALVGCIFRREYGKACGGDDVAAAARDVCSDGGESNVGTTGPERRLAGICASLVGAHVLIASDNLNAFTELNAGSMYSAGGICNTGIVAIQGGGDGEGAAWVRVWSRLLDDDIGDSRFAALTSDQQAFNAMLRRSRSWPGVEQHRADDTAAEAGVPGRLLKPEGWVDALAAAGATESSALRVSSSKTPIVGVLPLYAFPNGHVFFVQRMHERLRRRRAAMHRTSGVEACVVRLASRRSRAADPFPVLAVHATYTLGGHSAVAKRWRMQERRMLFPNADDIGGGDSGDTVYVTATPLDFTAREHAGEDKGHESPSSWSTSRALDMHLRHLAAHVRTLRALSRFASLANGVGHLRWRVAVPNAWRCYCDRTWAGSDNVLAHACRYPGAPESASQFPLPMRCPLDHIINDVAHYLEMVPSTPLALVPRSAWRNATSINLSLKSVVASEIVRQATAHIRAGSLVVLSSADDFRVWGRKAIAQGSDIAGHAVIGADFCVDCVPSGRCATYASNELLQLANLRPPAHEGAPERSCWPAESGSALD